MSSLYAYIDYNGIIQNASEISLQAADTHRMQIDLEIAELKDRLRYLYTARNALAPVHRLPSEILAKIFHLLRVDKYGEMVPKGVLLVSWASQHWREVALADPTLWDHINDSNYRWAFWCLIRSKTVPLFVELSSQATAILSARTMDRLYKELPRVHSLMLGDVDEDHKPDNLKEEHAIGDDLEVQPPELKHSGNVSSLHTLRLTGTRHHVADSISSYAMPHLAHLVLDDCRFDWDGLLVPSLKTLFVQKPHITTPTPNLLRLLSKMPLLEEVTLHEALLESLASYIRDEPVRIQVSCPNLTFVKVLDSKPMCVVELLNTIAIPLGASCCMATTSLIEEERIEDLFQPFSPLVHRRFSETSLSLDIVAISRSSLGILSFGFGQHQSCGLLGETTVQAITPYEPEYTSGDLLQLFPQLPWDNVRWLHITGHWKLVRGEPGSHDFFRVLETMSNVQELLLEDHFATEFLHYLASSPVMALPPALKTITYSAFFQSYLYRPLEEAQVQMLMWARRNGSVKMILRDFAAHSLLEGFPSLEGVFDEIYYDNADFLFLAHEIPEYY